MGSLNHNFCHWRSLLGVPQVGRYGLGVRVGSYGCVEHHPCPSVVEMAYLQTLNKDYHSFTAKIQPYLGQTTRQPLL